MVSIENLSQYVETASKLIDLPIDPEYHPGVIANLEQIAAMASLISDFPLDSETEPAPIFLPLQQNNSEDLSDQE